MNQSSLKPFKTYLKSSSLGQLINIRKESLLIIIILISLWECEQINLPEQFRINIKGDPGKKKNKQSQRSRRELGLITS